MKIAADISVEDERKSLISLASDNKKKQAETEAYRLQKILEQYKDINWKILLAISGSNDAKMNIALAFRELLHIKLGYSRKKGEHSFFRFIHKIFV